MSTYHIGKDPNVKTGQLPDRICFHLTLDQAWCLVMEIILKIKNVQKGVDFEIFGSVYKETRSE